MKKWLKYWPYALNVVLLLAFIWSIAGNRGQTKPLSAYTKQDIDKALQVKAGMKERDVLNLLGLPVKREFTGEKEEWHYCRTGEGADEYVAIRFLRGAVAEMEQYTVSWLDIVFHHTSAPANELIAASGLGDCKLTVRWGSYGQRTPQRVAASAAQQTVPGDAAASRRRP